MGGQGERRGDRESLRQEQREIETPVCGNTRVGHEGWGSLLRGANYWLQLCLQPPVRVAQMFLLLSLYIVAVNPYTFTPNVTCFSVPWTQKEPHTVMTPFLLSALLFLISNKQSCRYRLSTATLHFKVSATLFETSRTHLFSRSPVTPTVHSRVTCQHLMSGHRMPHSSTWWNHKDRRKRDWWASLGPKLEVQISFQTPGS